MNSTRFKHIVIAMASIAVVGGCSDKSPVGPAAPAAETPSFRLLPGPEQVNVVQRNTPLSASISRSASIGLFGGIITIPEAGLKVIVPPGAVLRRTTLTVTAPAGSAVAYEFGPHGTRFLVPLLIEQDLRNTNAYQNTPILGSLEAGYFLDISKVSLTSLISEILPVIYDPITAKARFVVGHFSGYLLASGRKQAAEEE